MKKTLLLLAALVMIAAGSSVFGQIQKEGTPPSSIYTLDEVISAKDFTPNFDWAKIADEDNRAQKQGTPMRAGFSVKIGLDINESGEWTRLPDGRMMWRISLKAQGATALGVVFDKYQLPEGSELYIYNSDKSMVNGALGSHNNTESGVLSTQVLYGDVITIEYIEEPNYDVNDVNIPRLSLKNGKGDISLINNSNINLLDPNTYKTNAVLHIGDLMYMYADIYAVFDGSKPATGGSAACQVDINCEVGQSWQDQKRGVAHTLNLNNGGWYFCSGTLVNNTNENFLPYFLQAYHCGADENGVVATAAERLQWQFYFNYERPNCGSGTPVTTQVLTGCEMKALANISGGSDFLLLLLNNDVPLNYNPFYNGWDRSTTGATSGASIHHPSGDVKKISTFSSQLVSASPTIGGSVMAANSAWEVEWASNVSGYGVTEGGSSGSPIFNQNGLQVGTLSGGSSDCATPTYNDYYGKFSYHWENNGTTADKQLKPWLDPAATDPSSLRGWDPTWATEPPVANFSASATSVTAGAEITFTDNSTNGPISWSWNFGSNAYPQTSTERNPKVTWVTAGTYAVTLTVTNSYGSDSETKNPYITVNAYTPPASPVTIGTGTNNGTYWPFGMKTKTNTYTWVGSASIYTPGEIGGSGIISQLEWRAGTAQTDQRNIKIYMKHTSSSEFSADSLDGLTPGATLVYNGTFTPSVAGWNAIPLQNNFAYNSNSNLMVIVVVQGLIANKDFPSGCYYTTATNKHQQWGGATEPLGILGTVNGNRPNIKITISGFSAPVANFSAPNTVYFEGFEQSSDPGNGVLPDGWVQKRTALLNDLPTPDVDPAADNWFRCSDVYGFGDPDYWRSGEASLAIGYTAPDFTWAISPDIVIPNITTLQLEFWTWYVNVGSSGTYPTNYYVKVYSDGVWTTIHSHVGTTDPSSNNVWDSPIVVSMGAYANKTIKLAFIYDYTDGYQMAIDDVRIIDISPSSVTIFEGETVSFSDISTNNPVVWYWQNTQGIPAVSYTQNTTVLYNVAGTYGVTLTAANAAGTDQEIKSSYVNVVGRAPIANFAASANFRNTKFQQFVPIGGTVNYTDLSTRVPTAWSWSFEGGNPSTSSSQNESVVYASQGVYDASLQVTNLHGNNTKALTDLVIVGGKDTVTNLVYTDYITAYDLTNGCLPGHGEITSGTDVYKFYQWAEYYENAHEGTLTAVQLAVDSIIGTDKNITVTVWDGSTGVPGTVLASKVVAITSFIAHDYNIVTFDSPVAITGSFFIGFVLNYDATHNYATHMFSTYTASSRTNATSTAWFKLGITTADAFWTPVNEVFDLETSMCIEPEFTYAAPEVTLGDVNSDMVLNVLDVVWLIDYILEPGSPFTGFNVDAANVNGAGGVDVSDVNALITAIMSAKEDQEEINSEVGKIYLDSEGLITFESDGTLTALQFELAPGIEETGLSLLLATDHALAFNPETGRGIIYSMTKTPFAAGKINLMQVEGVDLNSLSWGTVIASNINNQTVEVETAKYVPTSITDIANGFGILVYPNPNSGSFAAKVSLPVGMDVELQFLDILGRVISSSPLTFRERGDHTFEFTSNSKLSGGVYMLKVSGFDSKDKTLLFSHEEKLMIVNR